MASNDERTPACGNTDPHGQHTWPNGGDTSRLCLGSPEASNDDVRGVAVRKVVTNHGDFYCDPPGKGERPTHVAHSIAPEAQAKRRESVWAIVHDEGLDLGEAADAVLRVLGLST